MSDDVKALIFDCDGTLVDNMPAHFAAWREALDPYDIVLTEERFYQLGGVPTDKIVELLANETGKTLDIAVVSFQKEQCFERHSLSMELRPIEPVVAIAREHRGKLPMAVATGSLFEIARGALHRLGILDWFQTVVAAEDVAAHKPAPDVFLEAARRLDVMPEHCRAFEDTELGLQAIGAAGMQAIDIRKLIS